MASSPAALKITAGSCPWRPTRSQAISTTSARRPRESRSHVRCRSSSSRHFLWAISSGSRAHTCRWQATAARCAATASVVRPRASMPHPDASMTRSSRIATSRPRGSGEPAPRGVDGLSERLQCFRGSAELGQYASDTVLRHREPFPAAAIEGPFSIESLINIKAGFTYQVMGTDIRGHLSSRSTAMALTSRRWQSPASCCRAASAAASPTSAASKPSASSDQLPRLPVDASWSPVYQHRNFVISG